MVPLAEQDQEKESAQPNSATTFFAIPQPKRKTKEEPPPPAAPAPVAQVAGPPPGMMPGGQMMGGMGTMPGGMGMGMGIQGPIANGPVAGGGYGGAPVGYGGAPGMAPMGNDEEINRAQSYRVFAIVIGLMFMVFTALIVAVGLAVGGIYFVGDKEEAQPVAVTGPRPEPKGGAEKDTDAAPPPPPPPPKPAPRPSGGGGGGGGAAPSPRPAPAPAPAPVAATGPATITIAASEPFTGIEVNCPSGFRARGNFAAGTATVQNVPNEDCAVSFKGGPPAKNTIRGGQTKACTFPNGTAICN